MSKLQINSSYLDMPLDWNKYEETKWTVAAEKIKQLVKDTTEGLISTFKNEEWKFPFQAVKEK